MEKDIETEILVKLAKIEENTKGLDETTKIAGTAFHLAKELEKRQDRMDISNKWSWGFIITLGITLIVYFLTKL